MDSHRWRSVNVWFRVMNPNPLSDSLPEQTLRASFTRQKKRITLSAVTPFYGLLINLIRISACPFSVNSCRYRRQPIIFKDKLLRASVVRRTFALSLSGWRISFIVFYIQAFITVCFILFTVNPALQWRRKRVNESERVRRLKERMGREKMRKEWEKIGKRKKKRGETRIWEKMWKIKDKDKGRATPSVLHWPQSRTCLYFIETL